MKNYNQKKIKILPVILCGGTGSRLWPLSRKSYPKQFLSINKNNSFSFLQETALRTNDNKYFEDPIIVCNEEHRFIVAEQLRSINIKSKVILLEPFGRNTAPAVTLAAIKASEGGKDPLLLFLPSDHLIGDLKNFKTILQAAIRYCFEGKLVTFGVTPNKPETGYGYIEASKVLNANDLKGEEIIRFIEKPNKELAKKLAADKRYSWNSGIFLFKASVVIKEIKKNNPDLYDLCQKSLSENLLDLYFQRVDQKYFSLCEDISIDKAIMEKTNLGIVLPLNAGWNDIGSWQSLWEVTDKDKNGNVSFGKVLLDDVTNSYFKSSERLVAGVGVEDLIVVETVDAILVAKKDHSQKLKNIIQILEAKGFSEANIHKTIFRPWGYYTSIAEGENWQVKKITVKKGQSLSLQLHRCRTEHWIIVKGKALVEINEKESILEKNQSTYIPLGSKHRLSNPGNEPLVLIEVQSGEYLGEDDIIRFKDKYGRL